MKDRPSQWFCSLLLAATFQFQGCSHSKTEVQPDASAPTASASGAEGGGDAQADVPPASHELALLKMNVGGGLCSSHLDCWDNMAVRSPSSLVLEDKQGELMFALTAPEFERIAALARAPEFAQKVADSLAGRDCAGFDIGISMEYQWRGESPVVVQYVDSCALAPQPGEPRKILYEVFTALRELKSKHLVCPKWEEPPGYESGVDPLPQRAICWNCFGKCIGGSDAGVAVPGMQGAGGSAP